jgi:hypothetical protein
MTKSLRDDDMLTSRRAALRSFAAKTGLAAALIAGAVIGSTGTASAASDARNQTDTDTGQTDHD